MPQCNRYNYLHVAESREMTVYGEQIRVRDPTPGINYEAEDHQHDTIPDNLNCENM